MTYDQKTDIRSMKLQGMTYSQIAAELGLSANTVKAFLRREQKKAGVCKYCQNQLTQQQGHKPKTFCDNFCRHAWWKDHRAQIKHTVLYHFTCAYCGNPFESYYKNRKYCSHPCYIAARFGVP